MEELGGIEEKVKAILEKVKAFCEDSFSKLENGSHKPTTANFFVREEVALYALTGKLPKKPETHMERIKYAELLKVLTESEELQITGFNKNQKTGKIIIPTSMINDLIEELDEDIWGEKGTWTREYLEKKFLTIGDLIIQFKKNAKEFKSKSSFLGYICKGWLNYLTCLRIYNSNYKKLVFIYDLLNSYGINLIDRNFNDGNPTNKDKEEYIKGLMKSYRGVGVALTPRRNYLISSEWVKFL